MDLERGVVQINECDLAAEVDTYIDAIKRLADRTEREGDPGVLQYRFYADSTTGTAGAVIVYTDAAAWHTHHELAYQWTEMADLQATVRLTRLTLFGPLTRDLEAWLANAGITYHHYPDPAAGFVRS
jgi:quinol monooxygenase YgiN